MTPVISASSVPPRTCGNDRYVVLAIGRVPLPLPTGDAARAFGDWCVTDITAGTLEDYRAVRRAAGATVGCNRSLALLRAAFNWAIRMGYVERTPFMRGTQAVVKLSRELPRRRRLEPGEAARLLAACSSPHLRGLVEAALWTGCRGGELLSLQWHQVRADPRPELVMMASKTKNRRDRRIPISTRLAPVLAMRRSGPDGRPHPPTAYVFGNEVGQRVTSVRRIWQAAVLRAHGHRPTYNPHTRTLTPRLPRAAADHQSALSRSAAGGRLPVAGWRRAALDDSGLARTREHQRKLALTSSRRARASTTRCAPSRHGKPPCKFLQAPTQPGTTPRHSPARTRTGTHQNTQENSTRSRIARFLQRGRAGIRPRLPCTSGCNMAVGG